MLSLGIASMFFFCCFLFSFRKIILRLVLSSESHSVASHMPDFSCRLTLQLHLWLLDFLFPALLPLRPHWVPWVCILAYFYLSGCIGEGNGSPLHILAWRIPWTEGPGRYSPWSHRELDWAPHTLDCIGSWLHLSGSLLQGSVVEAAGLSCSDVHGILALQPGIEPIPPLQGGFFLTAGAPAKSPVSLVSHLHMNHCLRIAFFFGLKIPSVYLAPFFEFISKHLPWVCESHSGWSKETKNVLYLLNCAW